MGTTGGETLMLFDVDGTLTEPRQPMKPEFRDYVLNKLHKHFHIGIVGGSDLCKITEQLGGVDVVNQFDFVFAENGLVALKRGHTIAKQSIVDFIGEEKLQEFINGCLEYMSSLYLPVKRGTFIEYRTGLINVSPIGRNCSQEERIAFEAYDKENQIRKKFIAHLNRKFPDLPLIYVIGGQISFDVYPKGWDKSYALRFLEDYQKIYFFGDKCEPGGNDYEIYSHPRVQGFKVQGPLGTERYIDEILSNHGFL